MIPRPMTVESDIRAELGALEEAGLFRRPRTVERTSAVSATVDGRPAVLFCSNDYLGLSFDPRLRAAAAEAAERHGAGAGASRLITGTHPIHLDAERRLAALVGRPAALLFSTGYGANVGALSTLLGKDDVAFSDRLNHASLIDGLRLSRARVHVYEHADLDHLRALLATHRSDGRRAWVVTDTVFSMDGDVAPLRALRALADEHDAGLYVDEAHALGVLGDGRGACAEQQVVPDALVGTLGKAIGVAGAFVAGSPALRTLLENRARSYVFSTALPPALAQTIAVAADLTAASREARVRVLDHAAFLRARLSARGWEVPDGRTPIVPVLVGPADRTMALSQALLDRGFFVRGIRPPTVPEGTSRLRVVPTAAHDRAQLDGLLAAFDELGP